MQSLESTVSVAQTIAPIVCNNDTEGTGVGVDLRGYDGALAIFTCGISADTLSGSVSLLAKLQESSDNSTFTDVAAANLEGAFTVIDDPAEDPAVQVVGYLGYKRYLRVFVDTTGTHTNGTPLAACIVRGRATYEPT